MAIDCNDPNDQTQQSALNRARGPFVNSRGEYNTDQIDVFTAALAQSTLNDRETNPIIKLVNTYGDDFNTSVKALHSFCERPEVKKELVNYPDFGDRCSKGLVSSLEVAAFTNEFMLTPATLTAKTRGGEYTDLLFQLDSYYKNSFTQSVMGGFCASIPGIFGAIEAFFDIIGIVEGLIDDALSLINKIQNYEDPLKAAIEAGIVTTLIEKIKEKIKEAVLKMYQKVESAISNFDIEATIGNVSTFVRENVIKQIMQAREEACLFFNDENKKKIGEKIEGLIDYIVSLFESPGLQEIQFMITRFCSMAGMLEALMNDFKQPFDTFNQKYSRIANRLKNISNINTSTAIRNGAIRLSDEKRKETINSIQEDWESEALKAYTPTGKEPVNVKPPSISEYNNLPKCKEVKEGTEPRVKITGDWVEDKDCGLEGWVRLDLDLKVYLMRLQKELDYQFEVIDGFRSQQYNEKIGGAAESSHTTGLSVDLAPNGDIDDEVFAEKAIKAGFKTINVYSDRIHLDIRPGPKA